ncbi:hypothetical protein ACLOJK_026853 [Asimina triloba]
MQQFGVNCSSKRDISSNSYVSIANDNYSHIFIAASRLHLQIAGVDFYHHGQLNVQAIQMQQMGRALRAGGKDPFAGRVFFSGGISIPRVGKLPTPNWFPDQFGVTRIMEEERRRIITVGKPTEEVAMVQMSQEVLRLDAHVPSERELLEEVLAKARGMARERLEAEGERCHIQGMAEGERHFFF